MKMPKHADLGVRAALWMIQKQSPFCRNDITPRETSDGYHNFRPEWNPPEAGVAWAIYERSVLDSFGFTSGHKLDKASRQAAEYTAATGSIRLSTGKDYNLLTALGIDDEWAGSVVTEITGHYEAMYEEGWRP